MPKLPKVVLGAAAALVILSLAGWQLFAWRERVAAREAAKAQVASIQSEIAQIKAEDKTLAQIGSRWFDAFEIAQSSPRIALATPVQQMQALRQEATALKLSNACMDDARSQFVGAMTSTIEAFLRFMRDESGFLVSQAFEDASKRARDTTSARVKCLTEAQAKLAAAENEASKLGVSAPSS